MTTTQLTVDDLQAEADRLAADAETAAAALTDAEKLLAGLNQLVETGQQVDPAEYAGAAQNAHLARLRADHAAQEHDAVTEALGAAQQAEEQQVRLDELTAAAAAHAEQVSKVEELERIAYQTAVKLRDAIKTAGKTFWELESAARTAGLELTLKDSPDDGLLAVITRSHPSEPWRQVGNVNGIRIDGTVHRAVRADKFDDLRRQVRDMQS